MADKKDAASVEQIEIIEPVKKVKVKILANIKYGNALHAIGDKILILASEVDEFEALKVVEKLVFEKDENEAGE
jgi:hypothetical protein